MHRFPQAVYRGVGGNELRLGGRPPEGWRKRQQRNRSLTRSERRTAAVVIFSVGACAALVSAALYPDLNPGAASSPSIAAVSAQAIHPPDAALDDVYRSLPVSVEALDSSWMADLSGEPMPAIGHRLSRSVSLPVGPTAQPQELLVEYTLDSELTRRILRILDRGRVKLGHVIVLDTGSAQVLSAVSTDGEIFPPTRAYPAASLMKIVTTAAALEEDLDLASRSCHFSGNPYRLRRSQIDPPRSGTTVSMQRALALSNNQCFAQLAVHFLGRDSMLEAISRFGLLTPAGLGHPPGAVDPGDDAYDLGRLGCGLAGARITPLHAAQLASILARGEIQEPRWIASVTDSAGNSLAPPPVRAPRRVIAPDVTERLRGMLVDTTVRGTARSAFRDRRGRPLLGDVRVAGKTGSLSGRNPKGRYEWFVAVAPADEPTIAIAVLLVQGHLWWRSASEIGAQVLQELFCAGRRCDSAAALRWMQPQPPSQGVRLTRVR